jgi:hypothetical protein
MKPLTIDSLCEQAKIFSAREAKHLEPSLYGINDGKRVGTYLEQKFKTYLHSTRYSFAEGNTATGIDFPDLSVDIKTTSIRQPQSSCPFESARQKIYGLGYSLIVFVYDKIDVPSSKSAKLKILHTVFVDSSRTADFQMTQGIREILKHDANRDDLIAFMLDRNLPGDEIVIGKIADELLRKTPKQGYLTISNALQWRLQYTRVIEKAGTENGILSVYKGI